MRLKKALKDIFIEGNFYRIWQILTKSPLVHVLAWLHRLQKPGPHTRRSSLSKKVRLNTEQEKILAQLNQQGFSPVDGLFTAQDFKNLESYLHEKQQELGQAKIQQGQAKDFWLRLSDSDMAKGMTTDHPLVMLSLNKQLLEIIASYLKSAAFFEYTLLTYSTPSRPPYKISQLWHRDHDNDRMIKFFVYLSDVRTIEDGPFTLLPKEAGKKIKNSFFPRHLADESVEKNYSLSNKIEIKGPQFSAFLVDTSKCYHMGSRILEGHSRLMSTSLYVTVPKAYWTPLNNFVRPTRVLSELERAALDSNF